VKTFISAADIEEMASQGAREIVVDEDTVLTAVAREAAAQCGIKLVAPGAASKSGSVGDARRGNPAPTVSGKPKGCQHGPITGASGASRQANSGSSPVVDELIGAVKQMARVQSTR
jgi:hypothetical protein